MDMRFTGRKYAIGAEMGRMGGVHFRVWAPKPSRISLVLDAEGQRAVEYPMIREGNGYWSCHVPDARPGMRYRYRPDGRDQVFPDPASRYQPQGPHGPSQIIDPHAFAWSDGAWPGVASHGRVI